MAVAVGYVACKPSRLRPLPDANLAISIASGEGHRYALQAPPGSYLRVTVLQRDADVRVRVGKEHYSDNETGLWGREVLECFLSEKGARTLTISQARGEGHYFLSLDGPRPPEAADLRRLAGLEILQRAGSYFQEPDAKEATFRKLLAEAGRLLSGEPLAEARAWYRLASVLGHTDLEIELLRDASERFHAAGQDGWARLAYSQLASRYLWNGDLHLSRHSLTDAIAVARRAGNRDGEAKAEESFGQLCIQVGDWFGAERHFKKAEPLFQALGRRDKIANLRLDSAKCKYMTGRLEQARDDLMALLAEPGILCLTKAEIAMHLAWTDRLAGNLDTARTQMEPIVRSEHPPPGAWDRMGSILRDSGDFLGARACYREAESAVKFPAEVVDIKVNLAETAFRQGRPAEALELLDEAEPVFQKGHQLESLNNVAFLRTQIQLLRLNLGAQDAVASAQKAADNLFAGLVDQRLLTDDLTVDRTFTDLRGHYVDAVVTAYATLHRRDPSKGYDRKALSIVERLRARGLRELLAMDQIEDGPATWFTRQRELFAAIEAEESRLRQAGTNGSAQLRRLLDERWKLRALMLQKRRAYAAPQMDAVDLTELQRSLTLERLLIYHLGATESLLWVVDAQDLVMYRLPPAAEVEKVAGVFRTLLVSTDPEDVAALDRMSRQLGDMLLGQVAPPRDNETLLIVKDGVLHDLPFAALKPAGHSWSSVALACQPSATVWLLLRRQRERRAPAPEPMVVFADPVFTFPETAVASARGGVPLMNRRLPYTGKEADRLSMILPEAVIHKRFAANRENTGNLNQFRIIHFATHGFYDPDEPALSGIQLSAFDPGGHPIDGLLRTHEWEPGSLRADLVTLSACETARVRTYRGEGAWGHSVALLGAGASSVVVNLWAVDDAAGADFMEAFYRSLMKSGNPPEIALRDAREAQKKTRPAPFYWAGFILLGDTGANLL